MTVAPSMQNDLLVRWGVRENCGMEWINPIIILWIQTFERDYCYLRSSCRRNETASAGMICEQGRPMSWLRAVVMLRTLRLKGIWLLLKDSAIAWDNDNIAQQGAALSFFTVFSLSPLLILVIVLSSVGFGQEAASGHLVSQIRGLIGIDGANFVQSLITNAYQSGSNVLAAIVSVVMLLLGASAVFVQLRDSLNSNLARSAKTDGHHSRIPWGQAPLVCHDTGNRFPSAGIPYSQRSSGSNERLPE